MENPETTIRETPAEKTAPSPRRRLWRWGKMVLLVLFLALSFGLIAMWRDAPRAAWLEQALHGSDRSHGDTILTPTAVRVRRWINATQNLPNPWIKPVTLTVFNGAWRPIENRFFASHQILFHSDISLTNDELKYLSQSGGITDLTLSHMPLIEAQIKTISSMSWLRRLTCHQPLEAGQLSTLLEKMSRLEFLQLYASSVDSDLFTTLARVKTLKSLILQAPIGELKSSPRAGLELPQLTFLHLIGPTSGDAALAMSPLLRVASLETVHLESLKVTRGILQDLSQLPRLKTLLLSGCEIEYPALRLLASAPQLTRLDLNNSKIDDRAIPFLNQLMNLKSLILRDTGISPNGIQKLRLPATIKISSNQDPILGVLHLKLSVTSRTHGGAI